MCEDPNLAIETCEDCPHYDAMNGRCCYEFAYEEQLCPMVLGNMQIVPNATNGCSPTIVRLCDGGWTLQNIFDYHPYKPGVLEVYELSDQHR